MKATLTLDLSAAEIAKAKDILFKKGSGMVRVELVDSEKDDYFAVSYLDGIDLIKGDSP